MLDRLIRFSLANRLPVLIVTTGLLFFGLFELKNRPVDIFPNLNQPIVTVMAESPGLAPQEIETLVTLPIESALAGAPGVEKIRSISSDGLAIVRADFSWNTELLVDRQIVQERLQLAREDLPQNTSIEIAPISSITGEILDLGLVSTDGKMPLMELRSLAEWEIRKRLLSVKGVSQVVIIGGEEKQYQVLAQSQRMLDHGAGISDLTQALSQASRNTSGGYLVEGNRELLVRNLGRITNTQDIENLVVKSGAGRTVRIRDVARVQTGPEFARGAASVDLKPAVILVVFMQPNADTLEVTKRLDEVVKKLKTSLPPNVDLRSDLFRQADFLRRGVDNVITALRDGAILVVLVIFLFLLNLRASLITLVSLPLSFAITGILFSWFDLTLNTMTLGGLAIAVGELVDDAIVGMENTVRKIRSSSPDEISRGFDCLVADACSEVRAPIFSGTLIVALVFVPLFALSGIEGRLFSPLALAYITALLASMLVSLCITPILSFYLLKKNLPSFHQRNSKPQAPMLRWLQKLTATIIKFAVERKRSVVSVTLLLILLAAGLGSRLGSQFLPEFDEGTILVMLNLPPGTSLQESDRLAQKAESLLAGTPGVRTIARYTGRGEHDEHAPPVGTTHILLSLDPSHELPRSDMLQEVRMRLQPLAGINISVGQPLAHRIDHLLTGVQAQISIKVLGADLDALSTTADQIAAGIKTIPGVADLYVEPQTMVPQLSIALKSQRLSDLGIVPGMLVDQLEAALGGKTVGTLLEGERSFDLFVRLDSSERDSLEKIRILPMQIPSGGWARLYELADVSESIGPYRIQRDNLSRRLAVSCNTHDRSVGEVVADIDTAIESITTSLPKGMRIHIEGQFESKQQAMRLILILSIFSILAMLLILFAQFRSINLALQVLVCIPVSFVGGIIFLYVTDQDFSIAALVGFVSLAGIAARNGILLITHYLHLMRSTQSHLSIQLLIQAGKERAAPVVMTALTTGVGLLPLLLSASQTGREILYPVATVVIGGLLFSTISEFLLRPVLFWMAGKSAADRIVFDQPAC